MEVEDEKKKRNDKTLTLESWGDGIEFSRGEAARKGTNTGHRRETGQVESFRMPLATEDKNLRENLAWVSDVEVIELLTEDRAANKLFRGMRQLRKE